MLRGLVQNLMRFLRRGEDAAPPTLATLSKLHAYRWQPDHHGGFSWHPVSHPDPIELPDLIGIETAKERLQANTARFVAGHPANHALLWGSRGTGKSSLVKALANHYADQKLRILEVAKEDLHQLPRLITQLVALPYRFIIFCDDLSFEEDEVSYKTLKTVLEGGLESRPDNLLIYATSNRRHLMADVNSWDRSHGKELRPEEGVEERISLSDRFGLWIGFHPFSQDEYLAVVSAYAETLQLPIAAQALRKEALNWARLRGARSGRVARQFITDLQGRLG
uniref:AAA+ ATPase domain-containing protein n=1 Tax=Magnetococcus massalia (strain MO-1) TaxID=451514 RepID=A0A1S7LHZ9_MAGMO|nr:Conserved protein of unknown function. Putative ATPase family protein [Candidatus Magnetococcus massalia]